MLNLALIVGRAVIVAGIAGVGYCAGRAHGFTHATKVHSDNLKQLTIEMVSGWIITAQSELTVLEKQLEEADGIGRISIAEQIEKKKAHIADLNAFLTR